MHLAILELELQGSYRHGYSSSECSGETNSFHFQGQGCMNIHERRSSFSEIVVTLLHEGPNNLRLHVRGSGWHWQATTKDHRLNRGIGVRIEGRSSIKYLDSPIEKCFIRPGYRKGSPRCIHMKRKIHHWVLSGARCMSCHLAMFPDSPVVLSESCRTSQVL